ncbi:MAG: hypothetical protein B7C24_00745 [Bacteroidetes bacterium 4572_77]|nr:MAG: hypothetical protein B7C24_00745 [Bacteroidetes bacterium 4572_77]
MTKITTILGFVVLLVLTACQQSTYETIFPTLNDGKYDTEFPYKTCSKQIGEIAKSVKKLHCIAEYKTYVLPFEAGVTKDMISKKLLRKLSVAKKFDSESVIGTATIISYDQEKIALMTSAHVVSYPDTVIGYYEGVEKEGKEIVHTVSLKIRQLNYVRDIPTSKNLIILAKDDDLDFAILGQEVDPEKKQEVHVFDYPMGNSDELEWGSFVYIMGYPSGYQMITRGIVSVPGGKHKKNFLIDALFNKGISGGVVLAIKDGVPNFELVGMAKSVAANYENILVPEQESHMKQYNPNTPYDGDFYVKIKKEINYGITYSVASNSMREFIEQHRVELAEEGYFFTQFLRKADK